MKQQDYTIIFVIFLYIFVLRRLNFNISDSGDIVTLLLCFFLVFRSVFFLFYNAEEFRQGVQCTGCCLRYLEYKHFDYLF